MTPILFFLFISIVLQIIKSIKNDIREEQENNQWRKAQALPQKKLVHTATNYLRLIQEITNGKDPPEIKMMDFPRLFRQYWEACSNQEQSQAFQALVERILVLNRLTLLTNDQYILGLFHLSIYHTEFIRPVSELRLGNQEPHVQFNTILIHCLAQYPVPIVLDQAFLSKGLKTEQRWYIDCASGKNLRFSEGLPLKLTNRMVALLAEAPKNYTIPKALRWAQVQGLGGSSSLAQKIAEGQLGFNHFSNEKFWVSFLYFVIQQPESSTSELHSVICYLEAVLNSRQEFKFSGRSWKRLLEEAQRWREVMGLSGLEVDQWWSTIGLPGYEHRDEDGTFWFVVELTNQEELFFEGRALNHCVGEYADDCQSGDSAIFSLRRQNPGLPAPKPVATLEVNPESLAIVEASASCNTTPDATTWQHVKQWAQIAQINIAL